MSEEDVRMGTLLLRARISKEERHGKEGTSWNGVSWRMDARTSPDALLEGPSEEVRLVADVHEVEESTAKQEDLFVAASKVCRREGMYLRGEISSSIERDGVIRLVLQGSAFLPYQSWERAHHWSATNSAATLFLHLREENESLRDNVEGEVQLQPWHAEQGLADGKLEHRHIHTKDGEVHDPFSLTACFKSLPSKFQFIDVNRDTFTVVPIDSELAQRQLGIGCLPSNVLASIVSQLDAHELASLGQTCKFFKSAIKEAVPYLKLSLFPHQRIAVQWMLKRETGHPSQPIPHPHWRALSTERGALYLDTVNGRISAHECPTVPDFRGGLFCDEPGLGKTITGIALILKTLGTMALPPPGVQLTEVTTLEGRQGAYYLVKSQPRKRSRSSHDVCYKEELVRIGSPIKRLHMSGNRSAGNEDKPCSLPTGCHSPAKELSSKDGDQNLPGPDTWVGCDACLKWRKVPQSSLQIKENESWFCSMSPDSSRNSCAAPQEPYDHIAFAKAAGFLPCGDDSASEAFTSEQLDALHEENITFFRGVLLEFQGMFSKKHSDTSLAPILWWLLKTRKLDLQLSRPEGIIVSPDYRLPDNYGMFLSKLGLEKVPAEIQHELSVRSRKQGSGKRKGLQTAARESSTTKAYVNPHRWRQPPSLEGARLDLLAVHKAIDFVWQESRLSLARDQRFYLSAATLIIVPSTLIAHWEQQIDRHTRTGALRIHVLGSMKDTPPIHELAWHYDIVITTMSRLSLEWMRKKDSPLAQIHWLRIIIDEGHMLGSSLAITNKLQMACSLRADRRWIMTGTPTPNSVSSGVANLQPLLAFLHCEPYGSQMKVWNEAILRPLEQRSMAGLCRLQNLLSRIMIRATKSEIRTIPQLKTSVKRISFTKEHARSYNELVAVILRNLLLADWNDPDHLESLLSPKNSKWAREMLENVRMSCCIAGNCELEATETDIRETLNLLAERTGVSSVQEEVWSPPFLPEDHPLRRIENTLRHGGHCDRCREWARLIMVTPCAHLLCLECVAISKTNCALPDCGIPYKMQSETSRHRLRDNPNPKWPVPVELIEWQTAFAQQGAGDISSASGGHWRPNWRSTHSSKIAYLMERLEALGVQKRPGHSRSEESFTACLIPSLPYNAEVMEQPCKIIIFSQFWMHLQLIESRLSAHGYDFCLLASNLSLVERHHNINRFEKDPYIAVLLMDSVGSVGLDLSFVEHVFLMEPLADQSLEEQIVSRAHRMGARKTVHVETLVMKGTVEEHILELKASKKAMKAEDKAHASRNEKDEEGRAQVCGMLTKLHTISMLREFDQKGSFEEEDVNSNAMSLGSPPCENVQRASISSPEVPWQLVAEDRQQRRTIRFADC